MENFTIFIADDDQDDFFFIQEAFSEIGSGHNLSHFINGVQLVDKLIECTLSKNFPDLVLLDINMPKMNGIKALEIIKAVDLLIPIPIIMYSTSNDKEQIKKCDQLGANGFIIKSATPSSFRQVAMDLNDFINRVKYDSDIFCTLNSAVLKKM